MNQFYNYLTCYPFYHQLMEPSIPMNIMVNTINAFNPCQIPVDITDQPIFSLTKKLMIPFPEKFGRDKFFYLFRSLHTEKFLLIISGRVIKSSGLDEIVFAGGQSIIGGDFLMTVNNIKRASYCYQVSA